MRLAKLVDQSDLNDSQLSLFIGKNKGYINRIINGETFPTIKNFVIICRALKIKQKNCLVLIMIVQQKQNRKF